MVAAGDPWRTLPWFGCDRRPTLRTVPLRRPKVRPTRLATPRLHLASVELPEDGGGDGGQNQYRPQRYIQHRHFGGRPEFNPLGKGRRTHEEVDTAKRDSPTRPHRPHPENHDAHHKPGPLRDSSGSGWGSHGDILSWLGCDGGPTFRAGRLRRPQIIPASQTTPRLHRAPVSMPEDGRGDSSDEERQPERNDHHPNVEQDLNESRSNEPESIMPTRTQKGGLEPIPCPSPIGPWIAEDGDCAGQLNARALSGNQAYRLASEDEATGPHPQNHDTDHQPGPLRDSSGPGWGSHGETLQSIRRGRLLLYSRSKRGRATPDRRFFCKKICSDGPVAARRCRRTPKTGTWPTNRHWSNRNRPAPRRAVNASECPGLLRPRGPNLDWRARPPTVSGRLP